MAKIISRILGWGAIGVSLIAILVSGGVYITTYHPDAVEDEAIISLATAPQLRPGQQLKVLSWNLQFLAGRPGNNFFFDGGSDPWPSLQTVMANAKAVANIIRQEDPDVIFLTEYVMRGRGMWKWMPILKPIKMLRLMNCNDSKLAKIKPPQRK